MKVVYSGYCQHLVIDNASPEAIALVDAVLSIDKLIEGRPTADEWFDRRGWLMLMRLRFIRERLGFHDSHGDMDRAMAQFGDLLRREARAG